jgi:hypothetical protein
MNSAFSTAIPDSSLAVIGQLSENSRLGFASRNPSPHRGIAWSKSTLALGLPEWSGKTASDHVVAANNGPLDWVIQDYSLLRLKQTWWKWGLGYGAKVGVVKLLQPPATTVGALTGVNTLIMLGSTMIDATSPGMPLATGPVPSCDAPGVGLGTCGIGVNADGTLSFPKY